MHPPINVPEPGARTWNFIFTEFADGLFTDYVELLRFTETDYRVSRNGEILGFFSVPSNYLKTAEGQNLLLELTADRVLFWRGQ